ncbi:MAG: hypothetical protein K2H97_00350 [Prevotella sp.]|nr:hypothetical protein [Prevotella sp.]
MIELNKQEQVPSQEDIDAYIDSVYNYAGNLIVNQGCSYNEAKSALIQQGLNEEDAETVVNNIKNQIKEAKSEAANKEFLYGFLWAAGGVLLTILTGGAFIFYGAVLYGLYLLVMGGWHKIS